MHLQDKYMGMYQNSIPEVPRKKKKKTCVHICFVSLGDRVRVNLSNMLYSCSRNWKNILFKLLEYSLYTFRSIPEDAPKWPDMSILYSMYLETLICIYIYTYIYMYDIWWYIYIYCLYRYHVLKHFSPSPSQLGKLSGFLRPPSSSFSGFGCSKRSWSSLAARPSPTRSHWWGLLGWVDQPSGKHGLENPSQKLRMDMIVLAFFNLYL